MKPTKPSLWVVFSLFILAVGAGWILLSRTGPDTTTDGKIPAPRTGFLAPQFTLYNQQGQPVRLSDLRGRPVLINFWASWCTPCQAEMPAMQKVYQDYQDQGLEILAVNTTYQDDPQAVASFVQEHSLSFPILLDTDATAAGQYQVRALPTSFFVDADGIIRDVVVGGPMAEALLRIRVEQLIGRQAPLQETP